MVVSFRFLVSLHLLSGKFEPAVALAAAGSLFSQVEAFRF